MTNPIGPTPDTVAAIGDPGDETARRYRYQWTYAGIVCCMLLDETEGITEVFCEHHEDVLIKHNDGTFSGLQIKTRALNQDLWKTSDGAVKHSCAKFAKLEALFPNCFRAFRFLTNHPLYVAESGNDFRYVLQKIRDASSVHDITSRSISNFINCVAREANCTREIAFTTLSKTNADDTLPKLADIDVRLVDALTQVCNRLAECSYTSVIRAARYLSSECGRASSLAHQDILPAYLPATANPERTEHAASIRGKCINRSRLQEILDHGLNETAILEGELETITEPRTVSNDLLLKKLDAGGFSVVSRNSAVNLRDKAEYLGIKWLNKHGRESGLQRYGHIRSLVLSDAGNAFETTKNDNLPFGIQMRSELRSWFTRRRTDGSMLYECSNEHLEGFAYSLTAECQIQWSLNRPWEAGR
ncbi:MAG: DUF4297 domain-containing protein [Chlorobiales bacterium]|nr:DUF4297 domain-containing protein [Chlorobiales bacterium]